MHHSQPPYVIIQHESSIQLMLTHDNSLTSFKSTRHEFLSPLLNRIIRTGPYNLYGISGLSCTNHSLYKKGLIFQCSIMTSFLKIHKQTSLINYLTPSYNLKKKHVRSVHVAKCLNIQLHIFIQSNC